MISLVSKSCLTHCVSMDCSSSSSSVHGISQTRILEWIAIFSWDVSNLGFEPTCPALASGFFATETPGKP